MPSKNMSLGIGYDDEIYLKKARALYPRMKTSRLIHMIIREWLELRDKQKPANIQVAVNMIDDYLDKVKSQIKKVKSLNEFV